MTGSETESEAEPISRGANRRTGNWAANPNSASILWAMRITAGMDSRTQELLSRDLRRDIRWAGLEVKAKLKNGRQYVNTFSAHSIACRID